MRSVSLALWLFVFWLLLSGHYTPWLMGMGAASAIAVTLLGLRLGYVDDEGHPAEWLGRGLVYWPWLAKELVVSAWHVSKVILHPALPIAPRLIRVPYSQKTPVGIATYANSITLTPGTITVEVNRRDNEFLVHALTAEGAAGVIEGGMDRRVASFEGRR
jgi:multicomponent Na+:H+ antiporter subunit E